MTTPYNTCQPDADRTLGDFNLVGRLLVALNIAVIFWGSLVVHQLRHAGGGHSKRGVSEGSAEI